MFDEEKVTVVVPIYRVEDTMDECVGSVINQTYRNLEIILVDDGSPDACGVRCDQYADSDSRIVVIHQKNKGLSGARNAAIDIATGEYLTFVDSDDYISPVFIEQSVAAAKALNADIITTGLHSFSSKQEKPNYAIEPHDYYGLASDIQLEDMLYQRYRGFDTGAQGRLYKAMLFEDVRYPLGFYFEDLATTYKLFLKANVVGILRGDLYAYRINPAGLLHCKPNEREFNSMIAADWLVEDIERERPELYEAAICRKVSLLFFVLMKTKPKQFVEWQKRIWDEIKRCRKVVLKAPNARRKTKIACALSYFGLGAVRCVYSLKH